jgi:hypothetical protein
VGFGAIGAISGFQSRLLSRQDSTPQQIVNLLGERRQFLFMGVGTWLALSSRRKTKKEQHCGKTQLHTFFNYTMGLEA